MANIELTTATQTQLSEIAATLSPPVLSSLPAVTASKAGEMFWYNGTLWTYAKTGQFGTLAEGTPIPTKGYWEVSIEVANMGGTPDITVLKSESISIAITSITTASDVISFRTGVFVDFGSRMEHSVSRAAGQFGETHIFVSRYSRSFFGAPSASNTGISITRWNLSTGTKELSSQDDAIINFRIYP